MVEDSENEKVVPKRSRWRRRLIWLVVLGGLAWVINGPVTRAVAKHFLIKGLESQGATGTVEVEGTLARGLTLRNGDFAGEQGIQKLKFREAGVRYSLLELIDKKIRRVNVEKVEVVIDIAKFPPSEEEKEPFELDQLRETLEMVREIYRPILVDLKMVDVRLLDDSKPLGVIRLDELIHESGSEHTRLAGFHLSRFPMLDDMPLQDLVVSWNGKQLMLDRLAVLPHAGLSRVSVSTKNGDKLNARGELEVFDARVTIIAPTFEKFSAKLTEGALDFEKIAELVGIEEPMEGSLNELELEVEKFTGQANLKLENLRYGDYDLKSAQLALNVDNEQGELSIQLADKDPLANLKATFSANQITSFEDLKTRPFNFDFQIPELERLSKFAQNELPEGKLTVAGSYLMETQELSADYDYLEGRWNDRPLPRLTGSANLKAGEFHTNLVAADDSDEMKIDFEYELESQKYRFNVEGLLPVRKLVDQLDFPRAPKVSLKGDGDIQKNIHRAKGSLKGVIRPPESETTDFSTQLDVDWPKSFSLSAINLSSAMGSVKGGLHWGDDQLNLNKLEIADREGRLLNIDGSLPFSLQTSGIEDLLENKAPIDLKIVANEFALERFHDFFPSLKGQIKGRLHGAMQVGGTFARPRFDGKIEGRNWVFNQVTGIEPLSFALASSTDDGTLYLEGTVKEGDAGFAKLKGELPLTITEWLRDEKSVDTTPISLSLRMKELDLQRFRKAIPQLNRVEGSVDVDFSIKGTVARPEFLGNASLNAKRIRFENEQIPDLKDSKLKLSFDTRTIHIEPSSFTGSGGKYHLSGLVDLEGEEPFFNIQLTADKALVWRDDSLSLRSDGNLRLTGTLEEASLTGDLAIAESLYYKDIEIIPFGIPAGSVPTPQLPEVQAVNSTKIPLPEPYANWTLDVGISTRDPILIRGNLAEGRLVGKGRVRGTLGEPQITLDADLQKVSAELPLSKLTVKHGKITLRPGEGFIPSLNIRGQSKVGQHQVFIYVYGKASSPKLVFTSNPPLPEAEVLTLLATGTTTSGLEDQQVASVKAFQLLLSEMRRKYSKPGENRVVGKLLDALDTVDLRVGDSDPFSGRRFNSATLQLSSKFYASAAFDNQGNSRGIIIYALRF